MHIRQITSEELKNNIITKIGFPDAIYMDSSSFFNNATRYIINTKWIGLFDKSNKIALSVAELTKTGENAISIDLLETRKGYRNKGYASKLLKYIEKKICHPGNIIVLTVVDKEKVKFYQRLGYEIVSQGVTVHMQKILQQKFKFKNKQISKI